MFRPYYSIQRQLQFEENFIPPYCPNANCKHHLQKSGHFYVHGYKPLKRFPYLSKRYRCSHCLRTFSASFFSLDFRQKIWGLNHEIFTLHRLGVSKCEAARQIGHSEHMVRTRITKMARWSLLMHAKFLENTRLREPVVYDGLENFSFSQYDPNNLNHAVGKNSLFLYDFNLCPINRKGFMSPRQEGKKRSLEEVHGAYPKNAIRHSTARILRRLHAKTEGELSLFSDRHYQYRRAIDNELKDIRIAHIMVSSKIARNFKNHLFAVNNIDMQARHNLASFKRETIAFAKHSVAMLESFVLYLVYRNYMRPKFWSSHRSDPLCSENSPAMDLAITKKMLSFKDFFRERPALTQVSLHEDWQSFYHRVDLLSRRKIALSASI